VTDISRKKERTVFKATFPARHPLPLAVSSPLSASRSRLRPEGTPLESAQTSWRACHVFGPTKQTEKFRTQETICHIGDGTVRRLWSIEKSKSR